MKIYYIYLVAFLTTISVSQICFARNDIDPVERIYAKIRIDSLNKKVHDQIDMKLYDEAIIINKQLLNEVIKIYGYVSMETFMILMTEASIYEETPNYDLALQSGLKALDILKVSDNTSGIEYGLACRRVGDFYSALGNYLEAKTYGIQSLEILKNLLGENNSEYIHTVINTSTSMSYSGDYQAAIQLLTDAMRIIKNNDGKTTHNYVYVLSNLASNYSYVGNYKDAIEVGTEAIQIAENISGKHSEIYASILSPLASYYYYLGEYQKAIILCREAAQLRKEVFGENDPSYATALQNLATYYLSLGNNREAMKLTTEALKIRNAIYGKNHIHYAYSLSNLSSCYSNIGKYEIAIQLTRQALEIIENTLGKNHNNYASLLNDLAVEYAYLGDYHKAIEIENESLKILKDIFGKFHPSYAKSLRNLATYYGEIKNFQEAIRIGRDALEILDSNIGQMNTLYAATLSVLAVLFAEINNYETSLQMIDTAINIYIQFLNESHPELLTVYTNLISCLYDIGDTTRVKNELLHIYPQLLHLIKGNFLYLPYTDRLSFWDKNKIFFQRLYKYIYLLHNQELYSYGYSITLFSKAILLNSEHAFTNFIENSESTKLLEYYNEIKELKLQLNKLYERPIPERYCNPDSLERQASELERKLMYESSEFGDYTRTLTISWQDVRDNLKDKDVAIEFVSFPINNDSTMYAAYVLRKDMNAPELVKLLEEKEMSSLNDTNNENIYDNIEASKLIWGKLAPYLDGIKNVYFAPDGILHQIAIEHFRDFDGEGLISDRYNLHRLSSTREIALNKKRSHLNEAVVYGGIRYNTDTEAMETESRKYDLSYTRGDQPYYNLSDSLSLRAGVAYLPFTLKEAETIDGLMKENDYNPAFISGNEATEESFKSLSGQHKNIIHISTHGFYWQEDEAERKARANDRLFFMSQFDDHSRRSVEDKALTRTGLFMAGANNALSGKELPENVDDGLLTAQEIANLDLRGLDLVVLSACQTGMGDIGGDGVFGLQRGFKKAGANSILMSLWDVDDEATQILMTEFYRNYLGGLSKSEALASAQKKLRETSGFEDPSYWAAFILLDGLN